MADRWTVGVLTSGGDAPGMNAAIRSVVRMAASRDWQVVGFVRGYSGLIQNDAIEMAPRTVANILQRGGTILKTARSEEFLTEAGRMAARSVRKYPSVSGSGRRTASAERRASRHHSARPAHPAFDPALVPSRPSGI